MSDPLADFMLARIAEDEDWARAATPGPWWTEWPRPDRPNPYVYGMRRGGRPNGEGIAEAKYCGREHTDGPADAGHIARHNPARVLADCAAKRRLVERYVESATAGSKPHGPVTAVVRATELRAVLKVLAAVWADHPDYRSEWGSGG